MSRGARWALITFGVLGLGVLLYWLTPYYSTHVLWFVRSQLFWAAPVVALAILWFVAAALWGTYSPWRGLLTTLLVLAVPGLVSWIFVHNYVVAAHYAGSVVVTDAPAPVFEQRVPYSVSAAQVRSNLGDIPGDTQNTKYRPDDEVFATLVERRGFAVGYQTLLEQQITQAGRNTPSRCDFDPAAGARLGGWFGGNLGRVVNGAERHVNWNTSDAYGWCDDDGTPHVVVPLVQQSGWLVVTQEPAGVAVYDGRTGAVEIRGSGEGLPGPTYPMSLVTSQRASTGALDGFWSWLWRSSGWELPDEADSINSGNDSEFLLATGEDDRYVTPMSGRGAATAISALAVVDAHLAGPGLAPVAVHRLTPDWTSVTAITDRIRANFGDVFAQQRDSGIYELAPTGPETWVATIGTPQNMLYRVTGYGDLREDPCLIALDGSRLRCGATGDIGIATGDGGAPPVPVPVDADLAGLTPEQLADLNRRIVEELARRAGGG